MFRRFPSALLVCLAVLAGLSGAALSAEPWLSQPERDLLVAYGLSAKIGAKTYNHAPNFGKLPDVAARAASPLKEQIDAIAHAREGMEISADEKKRFEACLLKGQALLQNQGRRAVGDLIIGNDPKDYGEKFTQQMFDAKVYQDAWQVQIDFLNRKLPACATEAAELRKIVAAAQARAGHARSADDFPPALVAEDGKLFLTGQNRASFETPIVEIVLHKKQSRGTLAALNQTLTALFPAITAVEMDAQTQALSNKLTQLQEEEINLPIRLIHILPTLPPRTGVKLEVVMDRRDIPEIARIVVTVSAAEGSFSVDRFDRLAEMQKLAVEQYENPSSPPPALDNLPGRTPLGQSPPPPGGHSAFGPAPAGSTSNPLFGNNSPSANRPLTREQAKAKAQQEAQQAKLALDALGSARQALARKDLSVARVFLNQAIALAPDSPAAKQAQKLLADLDK